jgi:integrase/recombinase XerC
VPAVALSRVSARVVESGPGGEGGDLRVPAGPGLDAGLLIDADQRGSGRRVQVQAAHLPGPDPERGVIGASTMNRRVAAVRGLVEFAVMTGVRTVNPVPAARRSSGLRASPRGLLGHVGASWPRGGGRLVRQPRRLPESLEPGDVAVFLADLRTFQDRAIMLAMLLGGLRAAEVRSLRLAAVDMGLRRVRVTGKGGRERRRAATDRGGSVRNSV